MAFSGRGDPPVELDGYKGRLGIHGPFWGFKIDSQDPLIRAVVTKRLAQGLEACEAVGATQMVIHSPYTTWDYNNLDINPGYRACTHRTGPCRRSRMRAARREHRLRTRHRKHRGQGSALRASQLARSFNSQRVRVSLDTGHAHYAHISTGAPPVDYYVDAAGDMLAHVHIQDTDGYSDRHWLPGDGTVRWAAVFRALGRLSSKSAPADRGQGSDEHRRGAAHLEALGLAA